MKPIQLVSPFLLAAGLALRLAGMDNVRILQGGFSEWKAKKPTGAPPANPGSK